jgi:tetratricopeptide (TPR) repeat protein
LPPTIKKATLVLLLVFSAAAINGNSQKYDNEKKFWESAVRSCPNNSFFLNKYAGELLHSGDFIRSEILLRRALTFRMKIPTAAAIALQLADTAFARTSYEESLMWLNKAGSLPLSSLQAGIRRQRLQKIHMARGDMAAAEAVIMEMTRSSPAAEIARRQIELSLAFADWEKARSATTALITAEAEKWSQIIKKAESDFRSLDSGGQARYFIARGNFATAWEFWPGKDASGILEKLQTAKLAFLAGHKPEGKQRLARLTEKHKNDFKILNAAGDLLFDLQRADEALPFYERSLHLNLGQVTLRQRIEWIKRAQQEDPY